MFQKVCSLPHISKQGTYCRVALYAFNMVTKPQENYLSLSAAAISRSIRYCREKFNLLHLSLEFSSFSIGNSFDKGLHFYIGCQCVFL